MPTSLEHGPKYKCRKVNSGCHTLEMRMNGIWHDIPNITYLKRERREEGRGFKRVHNQMGEARPPKTTEHCCLAYIYMLASLPFLLAPWRSCPSSMRPCSMCVHAKTKTRNQQTSNGRKRCKEYMKRHKADKHDGHGKQRNKKASKQAKRQTSKKANNGWCPRGKNVSLDRVSISSLCWSMDDTLASKTHA